MMTLSRPHSIARTLTWMNVLVCSIALTLVYLSCLAYNLYSIRQSAIENLSEEAQVVGANSISAIVFDDRASAQATLAALSHSSDVVGAAIYTVGDDPFAKYPASGGAYVEPRPFSESETLAYWTNGNDILIGSRVRFQGKSIGAVYVQAHLRGLGRQALEYAAIAAAVLLFCLFVATFVGSAFRRILTQPIVSLADTARLVTRYRDYSLRFSAGSSYDEAMSLSKAFNEMLTEIQQRDAALEQAKVNLEVRIEERTAQLQAANRELEAFSYTVAHDLRSPLQTIGNVCFLLQASNPDKPDPEIAPLLSQLRTSVSSMSVMIDDLLDLSRSTSAPLRLKQIDLSLMATNILQGLAQSTPDRVVKAVVEPRCFANADSGLMQIVLQNLLRNAWKFTSRTEMARIKFGCTHNGKTSVFYVNDNGAGYDPSLSDRLFKPFQRLHAASEFPGTGIGLATVQRIIQRHGGKVWAEGAIEKGAAFYFTLDGNQG